VLYKLESAIIKKDLKTILENHNSEQQYYFSNPKIWANNYIAIEEYQDFLDPHCEHHESILNPLFLFEIKNLEALSLFKQVQCRDGLLPALLFFLKYPTPLEEMDTDLYIHHSLYPIVPKQWLPLCQFYKDKHLKDLSEYSEESPVYIIYNENQEFSDLPDFKKKLEFLFNYCDKNDIFPHVKFVVINKNRLISKAVSAASDHLFNATKELLSVFPDTETISWEKLETSKLNNSIFLSINSHHYHIADNYIEWHFLSKGSISIINNSKEESKHMIRLSPFHGLEIFNEEELSRSQEKRDKVQEFINSNKDRLTDYNIDKYNKADDDRYFLAPSEYHHFAEEVLKIIKA